MTLPTMGAGPTSPGGVVLPSDFTNLAGWWKNGDGTAGSWTDSSGNARHLLQATAGLQPSIQAAILDGFAVRRCDGADDFMIATFALNAPYTIFSVVRYMDAFTTQDVAVGGAAASALRVPFRSASTTAGVFAGASLTAITTPQSWHVYSAVVNGASSSFRVDGGAAVTGDAGSGAAAGITVGALGGGVSEIAQVDAAEVAAYTGAKSDADVLAIVAGLRAKYPSI